MDGATGSTIAIGIVTGVLSSAAESFGLTMQRKSHMLEEAKPLGEVQRPPYKRKRWIFGMALFLAANIFGSGFQISALPLVILAPLQASSLVFNSIWATVFLSEPFTRYSLLGTILVAAGAILIAAFGAVPEPNHTLEELLYLLAQRGFLVWFGSTILVAVILLSLVRTMRTWKRGHTRSGKMARGIMFGVTSGILSAHSLLLAKSAVELLLRSIINKDNQFVRFETWLIILGLIINALTELYILHQGLKLCSTSVLYPLVFCIYNIVSILDGLIYFQQASRLSGLQIGLVALGTIILLAGVGFLSWRLTPDPKTALGKRDMDTETMTTLAGNSDEYASEGDGLLSQGRDEESTLESPSSPLKLRKSSTITSHSQIPWLSKKLGYEEQTEIWDELGDMDDVLSENGGYLIPVTYNDEEDEEDEEDSISDESLTATNSSTSATATGPLDRIRRIFGRI
ncbi:magnesium transporter NIPA-domain-containing protein [Dipodascopsis uninucleata]